MPFTKYGVANEAQGQLLAGIGVSSPTLILKSGQGGLFPPSLECPFFIKLEKYDTALNNYRVLKREIAICTNRSGDTLTITRSAGYCPASYSATTQTNTAFSFDADDTVTQILVGEQIEEIQAALEGKVDIVAGLRTGFWTNKHVRVNLVSGLEESIAVAAGTTPASTDKIRVEKAGGTYEDILYSAIQADMAIAGGGSTTITPNESTIAINDPVGITEDWLFECTTENKTSINISASTVTMLGSVKLNATRTFFMYYSGLNVYGRVWTLTLDTMSFGTELLLGTGATGTMTGGCCEIGTNKVVVVFGDGTSASANNANHIVCTIIGTTILAGATYTYSMPNIGGAAKTITTVFKVRTECYGWSFFNVNVQSAFINSVSGTVITINGTPFAAPTTGLNVYNWVYLSDNLFGFPVGGNGVPTSMNMYAVTPGGVTIDTTYTGASSDGWSASPTYLARISNTEYVATFSSTNQNTVRYTRPPSGTALIVTNLVANGAVARQVFSVWDCFAVVNSTTISIYNRTGQLGGTITGITSPASNLLFQYFRMSNARIVYITGTNGTVRIINFARVFYLGIANNTVGGVLFRGFLTITGIAINQSYYVQADGTIGETLSEKLIGRGIAPNTLLVW